MSLVIRLLLCLLPSAALADLSEKIPKDQPERPKIAAAPVPCLRGKAERRCVVQWWIVNKHTGERISVGGGEVRLRC